MYKYCDVFRFSLRRISRVFLSGEVLTEPASLGSLGVLGGGGVLAGAVHIEEVAVLGDGSRREEILEG